MLIEHVWTLKDLLYDQEEEEENSQINWNEYWKTMVVFNWRH